MVGQLSVFCGLVGALGFMSFGMALLELNFLSSELLLFELELVLSEFVNARAILFSLLFVSKRLHALLVSIKRSVVKSFILFFFVMLSNSSICEPS